MPSALRLEDYSFFVRLGCGAEERSVPQEVRLSIEFRFHVPPEAEQTDELNQTICYKEVCDAVLELCDGREFRLLEKLASEIAGLLRKRWGARALFGLRLHKVAPPILGLCGGSIYQIGDFLL